jgi:putative ABC transport system permease protein
MKLRTRIFRFLLRAYPKDFRLDYGKQLEQVFRRDYEDEARQRGVAGTARLWWETTVDIFRTAPREHLQDLAPEIRYAGRTISRHAAFSLLVICILALGIGAATAVFSVVNAVAFRRLPFPHADQLVSLWETPPHMAKSSQGSPGVGVSSPLLMEWLKQAGSFDEVAAVSPRNMLLRGDAADSETVATNAVTANFFSLFGAAPARGRSFVASDYSPGDSSVAILSHALWTRRFGGDPGVLGRQLVLNDRSYTVVGVMPADFAYPSFYGQILNRVDLWRPIQLGESQDPGHRWLRPIARLRTGVSLQNARAEAQLIASRFATANPKTNAGYAAEVQSMEEQILGGVRPFMVVLFGASLLVLLIALVNVTNLLLVNAVRRERELALRTALGAGRARLARQLIVEGLLLSLVGASLGLWLAQALVRAITSLVPSVYPVPRLASASIDAPTLIYTLSVAACAGVMFGLLPAAFAAGGRVADVLKEGSRASGGAGQRRAREVLVVCQIALSLVLLTGAGILLKSLLLLHGVNPGFRPDDVLTLAVRYSPTKYEDHSRRAALLRDLLRRIETVPGVRSAALAHSLPLPWPPAGADVIPADRTYSDPRDLEHIGYRIVSPDYLSAMGISLVEGRDFTDRDAGTLPTVALINQSMARRLWPGSSAIGKRLRRERPPSGEPAFTAEIAGVFSDVRQANLAATPMPEMFLCYLQLPPRADVAMAIRLEPGVRGIEANVRQAILSRDRELAVLEVKPMDQIVADSLWRQRFSLALMGGFGCVALVLAAAGIFGVMSHVVAQRRQEFGIRLSLGATPSVVLGLVLRRGLILTGLGLISGGIVVGGAGRAIAGFLNAQGLLFGTNVHDFPTLAGVGLLLTVVSLAASSWPAWKATRVDPIAVLRSQ